jgi:hypothetical protein
VVSRCSALDTREVVSLDSNLTSGDASMLTLIWMTHAGSSRNPARYVIESFDSLTNYEDKRKWLRKHDVPVLPRLGLMADPTTFSLAS